MKYNSNQLLLLLMGLLSLLKGFYLSFNPSYQSNKFGFLDFGEYHYIASGSFILFGLFVIYSIIRTK